MLEFDHGGPRDRAGHKGLRGQWIALEEVAELTLRPNLQDPRRRPAGHEWELTATHRGDLRAGREPRRLHLAGRTPAEVVTRAFRTARAEHWAEPAIHEPPPVR